MVADVLVDSFVFNPQPSGDIASVTFTSEDPPTLELTGAAANGWTASNWGPTGGPDGSKTAKSTFACSNGEDSKLTVTIGTVEGETIADGEYPGGEISREKVTLTSAETQYKKLQITIANAASQDLYWSTSFTAGGTTVSTSEETMTANTTTVTLPFKGAPLPTGEGTLKIVVKGKGETNATITLSKLELVGYPNGSTARAPKWEFNDDLSGWDYSGTEGYKGAASVSYDNTAKMLKLTADWSQDKESSWPQVSVAYSGKFSLAQGVNYVTMDVAYDAAQLTTGGKTYTVSTLEIGFVALTQAADVTQVILSLVGSGTTYKGDLYPDNIDFGTAAHIVKATVQLDHDEKNPDDTWEGTWAVNIAPHGNVVVKTGDELKLTLTAVNQWTQIKSLTVDGTDIPASKLEGSVRSATYTLGLTKAAHTVVLNYEAASGGGGGGGGGGGSSGASPNAGASDAGGGASAGETLVETKATVSGGAATAEISSATVADAIAQAAASETPTDTVTISATVDSGANVTKSEVSIQAADLGSLGEKTDADLRVESPVAALTIANEALGELAAESGPVTFSAEVSTGGIVDIAIAVGGERVLSLTGGITAEVPVECTSGTVAMLLDDSDGAVARATLVLASPSADYVAAASVNSEGKIIARSYADGAGETMTVTLPGSAKIKFVDNAKTFTDVPATSWAKNAVDFVSSHGIFGGIGDNLFDPNTAMNRAMLVKVLHNFEGNPEATAALTFKDVPQNEWYADAVAWATANGVINGMGDGLFGTNHLISCQDLAAILYRYAGSPEVDTAILDSYTDSGKIGGYAKKAMAWAVNNRLLSAARAGELDPRGSLTRAQIARVMMTLVSNGL